MAQRKAFKMKLNPGQKDAYISRHNPIWPELTAHLKTCGISDYWIFLDEETNILFGTFKFESDALLENVPNIPIMKDWWAFMADIMETNPDQSPVSIPLTFTFKMDE